MTNREEEDQFCKECSTFYDMTMSSHPTSAEKDAFIAGFSCAMAYNRKEIKNLSHRGYCNWLLSNVPAQTCDHSGAELE